MQQHEVNVRWNKKQRLQQQKNGESVSSDHDKYNENFKNSQRKWSEQKRKI